MECKKILVRTTTFGASRITLIGVDISIARFDETN